MSTRYIVGFSRQKHIFAKAIMWFTRSNVSHVYIRQESEAGRYVLESRAKGVRLEWCGDPGTVVQEFEVDHVGLDRAWAQVCSVRLNRAYGWSTIVGDAYVYAILWLTGKWVTNPFPAPYQDVCSELVLAWILHAGIPGFDGLDRVSIAPADGRSGNPGLLEVVRDQPQVFRAIQQDTFERS